MRKIISLIFVSVFCCLILTSCIKEKKDFSKYKSGEKIEIYATTYLDFVSSRLKTKIIKNDDNSFYGIEINGKIEGYDELSYYNIFINFEVNVDALNELGYYENVKYTFSVPLDKNGNVEIEKTFKFEMPYRNVKNLKIEAIDASGFIVIK